MADDKKPDTQDAPEPTDAEKAEASYWEKFDQKVNQIIDARIETVRQAGTTRGQGRTTLPGMLANFVFGPEKK